MLYFYQDMLRLFCSIIFRLTGWKVSPKIPAEVKRCIVIAAPHTSNWDFWYAMAGLKILGLKTRYTIKKEWMRFPFSMITRPLGGIAIDRSPKKPGEARKSQTEAMIQLFRDNPELMILITPEGTRSKRTEWRTGFYHVAIGANVPICLGYIDYKKKVAGIGKTIYPSDMEKDIREIMAFYSTIHPKFPEKFSIDQNYA